MSYRLAILLSETDGEHQRWIRACESEKYDIECKVIDITESDWIENIRHENFDCILVSAFRNISFVKQLYDERLFILHNVLKKKIYPSIEEILIYENKKLLSYWLTSNNIPHPKTWIFYRCNDALKFIKNYSLPIVAKTSIGASGSGVHIFKKRNNLKAYIKKIFSHKGVTRKWGPNLRRGEIATRFIRRIKRLPSSYTYFRKKHSFSQIDPQRMFVILQEFIKCDFEWRVVRIGDSYFAHKKLRNFGEMFSGTSKISWDNPPEKLLNFVKDVCDKGNFLSQAVDIFEDEEGRYLVNEMQCFFGSKNPHQMIIEGKPGRYIYTDSRWIFEEGNFNANNSYDLRLDHVINLLNRNEL